MGQRQNANSPNHEHSHSPQLQLSLAAIVVWFRDFITIVDDGAVGGSGGGNGSWGSRPARLLKVIDQRVGCAHEAVQLVSKCPTARYLAVVGLERARPDAGSHVGLGSTPSFTRRRYDVDPG